MPPVKDVFYNAECCQWVYISCSCKVLTLYRSQPFESCHLCLNEWSLESLGYIKIFLTSSKIYQDKFCSSARRTNHLPRHESFEVVFVLTVCWQRTTWLSRLNLRPGRPWGSWDFRWGWEGHSGHTGVFMKLGSKKKIKYAQWANTVAQLFESI